MTFLLPLTQTYTFPKAAAISLPRRDNESGDLVFSVCISEDDQGELEICRKGSSSSSSFDHDAGSSTLSSYGMTSTIRVEEYTNGPWCVRVLYHFDRPFMGCDVWCSWTLPDRVHKWILAVTGTKSVRFAPKYYLNRQVSHQITLNQVFTAACDPL